MKKILFILIIPMIFAWIPAISQTRSITFIEKPFSELLAQAKTENKLIFLDAYTTWCGPCKWMAANMFTKDTIADYFNKTFVCAHFDMEKGEGPELAKTFQVMVYPTLLFINSAGELVHKQAGALQNVREYFDMATVALTPGEGFIACMKKFSEGNRDPGFILKYLDRLQGAYMPVTEPLNQYFASVKAEDLLNRPNWDILYRYLSDMDSREFAFLLKNQDEFAKRYTKDSVDSKIFNVYFQSLTAGTRNRSFTEADYNALKQKIRESGYRGAEKVIFTSDLNSLQMKGDGEKFISLALSGVDTYFSDDYAMLSRMAGAFAQITKDTKNLEAAAEWAKKSTALKSTAENNSTCASLMFKLGKKGDAIRYQKKAVEAARREQLPVKQYETMLKVYQE
ncbi:MAG: thioredoxin family protein [Bacteroidota bacterium]